MRVDKYTTTRGQIGHIRINMRKKKETRENKSGCGFACRNSGSNNNYMHTHFIHGLLKVTRAVSLAENKSYSAAAAESQSKIVRMNHYWIKCMAFSARLPSLLYSFGAQISSFSSLILIFRAAKE